MTLLEYVRAAENIGLPRKSLFGLLFLSLATTLAESLGLAMVVPIYELVSVNGQLDQLPNTNYWEYIFIISNYLNRQPSLIILLSIAFVTVILRQLSSYARHIIVAKTREQVTKNLRDQIFKLFTRAILVEQESLKSGELVNIITNELVRFNASLAGFVSLFNAAIMAFVYGIFLALTSWQMTFASALVVVISFLPLRAVYRRTVNSSENATKANIIATEFFVERLAPARLSRLSRSEDAEISQMKGFTTKQYKTLLQLERLMAFTAVLIEPIILGLVFFLFYIAVVILMVPMASIAVFLIVILRLLPVAKDVMKGRQLILACAGSIVAIQGMLSRLENSNEGPGGKISFFGLECKLCFEEIFYNYPKAKLQALKNINLTISSGSFVVIVGPSGSGKSTLIDLIPALRRPVSGSITIDGQKLEDFSLDSLRSEIAYVPQQAQIYDTTVAEHIRLGRLAATDAEIQEALCLAGAKDFVDKLPAGVNSRLGQAGATLSGGQRQRVDLARAILSQASVLILDEPTSALDTENEQSLISTLNNLRRERKLTIIAVTHRLALVHQAEHVVVMQNGRVEASGVAEEVKTKSEWFANALSSYSSKKAQFAEGKPK